ncbi:MAG: ATP-binding protein [Chloroflexota bacterium]
MRSWPVSAAAVIALLACLYAAFVALTTVIDPGVTVDDHGAIITSVAVGGFGWDAGLRPGQHVVSIRLADEPGGWAIEVGELHRAVTVGGHQAILRSSVVAALAGLALALFAIVTRRRPRRAGLLAVLAIGCAAVPVLLAYADGIGSIVIVTAALAPWAWLGRWWPGRRRIAIGALAAGAALAGSWLVALASGAEATGALRTGLVAWITTSTVLLLIVGTEMTPNRLAGSLRTTGPLDVAVITGSALVAIVLIAIGASPFLAILAVALPLVLLVGSRRRIATLMDEALLSDVRERESVRAMESERARLARELHDDPLQRIVGVIRLLDQPQPDTVAAHESLREVAESIRGVATELRPPVLDDLGLVPAITAGVRGLDGPPVEVDIAAPPGYRREDRPPGDVELAAYRVVMEAVANAVRHASATRVLVGGSVGRDAVSVTVEDDGTGMSQEAVRAAAIEGHMGLASMRRRAELIGARLDSRDRPGGGTIVELEWRR